VILVI